MLTNLRTQAPAATSTFRRRRRTWRSIYRNLSLELEQAEEQWFQFPDDERWEHLTLVRDAVNRAASRAFERRTPTWEAGR